MLRRGCAFAAISFGGLFAAYLVFFTRYFEWPGNLFAAFFGALFAGMGISGVAHLFWAWRDTAAFARAARLEHPADGQVVAVAGPIRPLGEPLTSPFGGVPCVAYDYEVFPHDRPRRGRNAPRPRDLTGFAMAASTIDTPHGDVRLLGFPILDQFPQTFGGPEARARAREYAATAPFEVTHGLGALQMVSAFDDALADADGMVRKDFRLTEGAISFERRTIAERVVRIGEQVCAVGRYDAAKRALVPRDAMPNRLWPGTAAEVRRKIVAAARSQATIALAFFAVSHTMLGIAFYMSETRHAREPEDRQASAIRLAVQNNDVAALERAVRRGANPNARDAFGNVVLLDVREPALAAALVRLGADVDAPARGDGDTLLIRAARMGHVELVRVLLAAQASVYVANMDGATALSEAMRGGHEEVAGLLRAAGATTEGILIERPSTGKEPTPPVPPSGR
jgi:Ankyrin repeats (3 copies)